MSEVFANSMRFFAFPYKTPVYGHCPSCQGRLYTYMGQFPTDVNKYLTTLVELSEPRRMPTTWLRPGLSGYSGASNLALNETIHKLKVFHFNNYKI